MNDRTVSANGFEFHVHEAGEGDRLALCHWVQQDQPEVVNAMLTAFLSGEPVPEHDEV